MERKNNIGIWLLMAVVGLPMALILSYVPGAGGGEGLFLIMGGIGLVCAIVVIAENRPGL